MTEADKLGHKVFASVSPSNDKSTINDHHFVYDYSIAITEQSDWCTVVERTGMVSTIAMVGSIIFE